MAPPPCGFPDLPSSSLGQMLLSLGAHSPLFISPWRCWSQRGTLPLSVSLPSQTRTPWVNNPRDQHSGWHAVGSQFTCCGKPSSPTLRLVWGKGCGWDQKFCTLDSSHLLHSTTQIVGPILQTKKLRLGRWGQVHSAGTVFWLLVYNHVPETALGSQSPKGQLPHQWDKGQGRYTILTVVCSSELFLPGKGLVRASAGRSLFLTTPTPAGAQRTEIALEDGPALSKLTLRTQPH